MAQINLAIAGVGNCASSLLQGIEYYRGAISTETAGLVLMVPGGEREHAGRQKP